MIETILALLGNILPGILKNSGANSIQAAQIQADLQKAIIEATTEQAKAETDLLMKQADINISESQAGRLGWRNWLGQWLTVALIYSLFGVPVIKTVAACFYFVGMTPDHITAFANMLPMIDTNAIWGMLGGLLGLYTSRGYEMVQHAKLAKV